MKIKDLLNELSKLDPDLELILLTEDEGLIQKGSLFKLFELLSVSDSEAEMCRLEDGDPSLRFCKTKLSKKLAIMEITSLL